MDSTYKSTQEQTGIYAGEDGYQITVGKNTDLNGSVITSTADASKNKLDTGTLTWNDLENKADYKVTSNTAGINSGGNIGDMFLGNMANTILVGANSRDKKASTTHAAVSEGEITIRDQANQTQDVASLNRDTEHANNGFSPVFDKEKEQNRLNEMKAIGELGCQISDVIRTEDSIYAYNEAQKVHPNFSADELKQTQEYKDAMKDYGTGGTYQKAAQAITAALQGLAGNNLEQALTGASSPYVAGIIKQMTEKNEPAHIMAHAVWGAIVANAKDSNAVAGAIGAATAEGLAPYIQQALYGDRKISELTEEEKQTIIALATIGAGLAGSFGSDGNFASGVAAAETGKNAVENNHSSPLLPQMDVYASGVVALQDSCMEQTGQSCSEEEMAHYAGLTHPSGIGQDPLIGLAFQGSVLYSMLGGELASVWFGGAIGGGVGGFLGDGSGQYVLIGSNVGSNNVSLIDVINGNTSGTYRKDGIDYTELAISTGLGLILGGTGGYLTGNGNAVAQTDKIAAQAQKDLINEINKFPSRTQATNTSTMIGAYDPITGKTAVGSSNAAITADALHPTTVIYIEKQLGVKIGEFTSFCKNKAGACAEVSGADALIRQGSRPENIKFTQALRPREVWKKETIPPKAIVETCENCGTIWPNGAHK